MRIDNATRNIYPGERVTIRNSGLKWKAFVKVDEASWAVLLGTWTPVTRVWTPSPSAPAGLASAAAAIAATDGDPDFSEDALELLRVAGEGRRSTQVIFYDTQDRAARVVTLDFLQQSDLSLEAQIAADEEYLQLLITTRTAAADTKGIQTLTLPDGTTEQYRGLAAVDDRIGILRDRISRERAVQAGSRFVGGYIS